MGVDGADGVEAHFIDEFLEDEGVFGEEVDAPLPIVEADGAGDDLAYFAGVAAADEAVFVHEGGALFEREGVPVFVLTAAAVHGVEADEFGGRDFGEEAGGHGFALAVEGVVDGIFPGLGVGLDTLCGEAAVDLAGAFVEAEFDDAEVGGCGLAILPNAELTDGPFGLAEGGEIGAEVDEHEVGLVAEDREKSAVGAHGGEGGVEFGEEGGTGGRIESAPGSPADAEHLMEQGSPFEGEGHLRKCQTHK